jgi:hypothetical protein
MARVWHRLTVAAVSGLLLLLFVQCNKQKPGDKCVNNGKFTCMDPSTAMLCQAGTIVTMPCRGPTGCQGMGPGSQCNDDLGQAGEPCLAGVGGENYACTTDMKGELVCTGGKWTVNSTCKGPRGCKVAGEIIHCDDDFADIGDACLSSASDANYSCTPDKKTIVVCQQNKFVEWEGCHGPKGCHIESDNVYCDSAMATEGDMCRHPDRFACADDSKSMMKCSPQFKWAKQQDCKRQGCKIRGNEVICE